MSRERHVDAVVRKHEAPFIVHQGGTLIEKKLNNQMDRMIWPVIISQPLSLTMALMASRACD